MAKTQSGSLPKLRLNSQSIIWPLSSFKSVMPRCSHWSTSCVSHHSVVGTVGKHPPANRTVQRISMPLGRYLTTKSASHSNSAGCGVSSCLTTGFRRVNCDDNHACPFLDARTLIIKAVSCKGGRDLTQLCAGLANLDTRSCGKIGTYALIYYFTTTLMAVILGIVLVVAIHPGNPAIKESHVASTTSSKTSPHTLDAFLDLFRNMFPENIIQACTKQISSQMKNVTIQAKIQEGNTTVIKEFVEEIATATFIDNTNVLGLVTFSVAFGLGIASMGKQGRLMLDFFIIMNEIVMRLVRIIMWYAPIGIIFLVIGQIIAIDDLMSTVTGLGLYMLTVITGLAVHLFLTLMLMYFIICHKNPLLYMQGLFQAFFMALGTGSSSATLPVTFKCLEGNLGIDARVTRFVLPIGATVNMDGTALYEAVACIFIAQINEYALSVGQLVTISITATLAAIGAAAVPSAGLVTMVMVLTSVGLPINDIALIFAVDWMLDRIRTSINVMGDAFGAGIVAHLCREQLRVPPKRLNSVSVTVPHTKWNSNQEDSGDECEGEDSNHQDISMELVEATLTQRE